ncbi:LptA/OstA family protein [Borreliella turdi]|uniref:LptA/OstA family protein n=1 Tax=Borreliella turdi TaxID=57863 RepID=UPI002647B6FD|nr:LptA/OstA family protein [Borreliella turdi]WKC78019.1 LptA/OstA family protein [Borreliella turdi]
MKDLILIWILIIFVNNIQAIQKESRSKSDMVKGNQERSTNFTFKSDFAQGIVSSFYKKIVLKGNSEVVSSDFKLIADEIEIYGENGSCLEARGNVFYEDYKNKMHVKAQFLFFNRKLDNFYLQKGVELEDLENNMLIKAERVEGSNKTNVYIMQYSVKIYKDDTFARSESGTYNKEEKEMILEGVPAIYQKDNYYSASRIIFNTKTNRYKLEGSVEGEFTQVENDVSKEKK